MSLEENHGILEHEKTASWNIVPWALKRNNRTYPPTSNDIKDGKKWLTKLLAEFEDLKVVVLCGNKAQKATGFLYQKHPELCVLQAPHPSPQAMSQAGKEKHLEKAIEKAARVLNADRK